MSDLTRLSVCINLENGAEKDLYDHVSVFLKFIFRETHKNTQLAFTDGENKINKRSVINIKYAERTHALTYMQSMQGCMYCILYARLGIQ